ncbi:MAG: hypothetical protein ACMUJK_11615 [Rhodobacterales bacterium]
MIDETSKWRSHIGVQTRSGFIRNSGHGWRSIVRFDSLGLLIATALAGPVLADAPSIYDYWLGDHIIDYPLSTLDVISTEPDGFGGQTFIRVHAPNNTEVVLTFRQPRNTLQYLEHDWIDRTKTAPTSLNLPGVLEFTFGQTRVRDIQTALGQQGFHYACRQLEQISGGTLTFVSFEVTGQPDAVYTFVAEHSQDLADRGMVDAENIDLTQAVLVATIISRPDYAKDFWCENRIAYTATPSVSESQILENVSFEDFLPRNARIADEDPWEVVADRSVMITKSGALTWGDRLYIMLDPLECTQAEFMALAYTYDDQGLLSLEGKELDGAFNLLTASQNRMPLEQPVRLTSALYAPIEGRKWPPFAVGSFIFGTFDFERIISTETDPSVFGFSLEFGSAAAGMGENYWSLNGLLDAGNEAMKLCRERE